MSGFFLPLSGGIDSSSTASLVGSMCDLVMDACGRGNQKVVADLRAVLRLREGEHLPTDSKELARLGRNVVRITRGPHLGHTKPYVFPTTKELPFA